MREKLNVIFASLIMKKYFLLLVAILVFLSGSIFSQTVYITSTGQHYHTASCKNVGKTSTKMQVSDALQRGYTPCPTCHPPHEKSKSSSTSKTKKAPAKTSTAKTAKSVQCSAKTKSGNRCTQMTKSPNGLCSQHGGN